MPASNNVISLPARRSRLTEQPGFSAADEATITRMNRMLADELAVCDKDSAAPARVYFYFSFHQYSVNRWMTSLLAQETAIGRQLAQQISDAFQYVTSAVRLDGDRDDRDGYRKSLRDLSEHLHTLLLLI